MRLKLLLMLLLLSSMGSQAMELQPGKHKFLSLEQYCLNTLTKYLIDNPELAEVHACSSFETLFTRIKAEQSKAHNIDATLYTHLLKRLKNNIIINYRQHLDNNNWREMSPDVQPKEFCLHEDDTHLCDYSSSQKMVATVDQKTCGRLLLTSHQNVAEPRTKAIDIECCGSIQALKFSPQGLYLVLTHLDTLKKRTFTCMPTSVGEHTQQLGKIQPKGNNEPCTLLMSHDDKYALTHRKHRIDVYDMQQFSKKFPDTFLKIGSIVRHYRNNVVFNPVEYQFAASDSKGNIDVYKINANNTLGLIGTIRCAPSHLKMNWLANGTQLLIQDRQTNITNILWDPLTEAKINIRSRLPYIASYQVAHSPCKKYMAFRTLKGVCILNLKTNEWSLIPHYYPERMHFNAQSGLVGIDNNANLVEHRAYEYYKMPLDQLIVLCLISRYVLKAPDKARLYSLICHANALCGQKSFITLPSNMQENMITHIYCKLHSIVRKSDPEALIVININDIWKSFTVEFQKKEPLTL